jgi:hypothetical protein
MLIIAVVIAGIGAWGFFLYPYYLENQRYLPVVDPSQAYMLSNGTLYLGVYNSWTQSVSINSVQVAQLPGTETRGTYSLVDNPNSGLQDGSVKILCCLGSGDDQVVAKSTEWVGGGKVPAGGVALLRFHPPSSTPGATGSYFLAIGSQWFPSSNLGTFTSLVNVNDTLPNSVPVHAVVFPNESMRIGLVTTGSRVLGPKAQVSFPALWIPHPLSANYSVTALGVDWYQLTGGSSLPPFMRLSENLGAPVPQYSTRTSFIIRGITTQPLNFTEDMVTQLPPIIAPTAPSAGSTSSSDRYTSSYGVRWQLPLNGTSTYKLPLILYGGAYWINSSEGIQVLLGSMRLTSPSSFNSTYFNGEIVVTLIHPGKSGTMDIVLEYGPPFQMAQTRVIAGNTVNP